MKKLFSIALSLIMIGAMFAGCSGRTANSTVSTSTVPDT